MECGAETQGAGAGGPLYETAADGGPRATLWTDDGVPIEAGYRPPLDTGSDLGIVLAHGFTGTMRRPAVRRAAQVLARYGGVVTFSFRGHGGSGGLSTVGDREVLDVDAAVRWARSLGHARVATVGFSMGGSVVLRQAGLRSRGDGGGGGVDGAAGGAPGGGPFGGRVSAGDGLPVSGDGVRAAAVVSVSSPARWYYRGTPPMRRLHWVVTRPGGRLVSRIGLRTRIDPDGWGPPEVARPREAARSPADGAGRRPARPSGPRPEPMPPFEAVRLIPPTPLLVVHGDRDAYFPLDHPRSLAEAAGPGCELWIERGFGHAENAAAPELLHRIGGWLVEHT
jgi:pimeloyl-ACP methyl ester carboxylesterase